MLLALRYVVTTLILLLSAALKAQIVRASLSNRYAAPGAYSNNFSDIFSATANQASIASLKTGAFGVYGERRFMLNDLASYTAIIAAPTPTGTFGLQVDYFGSSFFNETELGIIYARKISSAIDIGAKFNYHTIKVAGYGNVSVFNFDIGAIFHLTEKLISGVHVYNPTSSKLGKTATEKLESIYSWGLGYEVSKQVFIGTEIIKHEGQPVSLIAGLRYDLHARIFIRAGISTGINNNSVGVGLNVGFGRIDLNTAYHPQLGFTPGILLLINFKKPAEE
ncbi:hypothetical protein [Segetibacter sp.]|jgi:hypothetical protein|uniref:hypothetical protein n=1 Tax=Segetibacter sp. TaxID=2231182 RepID=UPI002605EED5|nr:hypothetical protein [Segetibacter sp.]MCW3080815.1 hypothetical protein [Segetibacter sp.]